MITNMKTYLFVISLFFFAACNQNNNDDDSVPATIEIYKLIDNGGRVDWYKGELHSKVLFDRITDDINKNTDLFIMDSDGSNVSCLSCGLAGISGRFVGQPAWHPDGIHCVIQVENSNSNHTVFEHVSFGFNNDLYLMNTQTREVSRIFSTGLNHAVLHPHFNKNGDKIIFAYREPTGEVFPSLIGITPGGENQWDGWGMMLADFNMQQSGSAMLSNKQVLRPNGTGFYETHQLDSKIVYSFTPDGKNYVDDCYHCDLDGFNAINLINQPSTWEEHASFSPSGNYFAFLSSMHNNSWSHPGSLPAELSTELYLENCSNGETSKLTLFNEENEDFLCITSDFSWSREGDAIVFLLAKNHQTDPSLNVNEIWKITFPEPK